MGYPRVNGKRLTADLQPLTQQLTGRRDSDPHRPVPLASGWRKLLWGMLFFDRASRPTRFTTRSLSWSQGTSDFRRLRFSRNLLSNHDANPFRPYLLEPF